MKVPVSRGALTAGAIGAYGLAACSLLLGLIVTMVRSPVAIEGFLYLYAGLGLISALLLSVGILASARVYGGMQIAAGVSAIVAGLGAVATLLVPALARFDSDHDAAMAAIAASAGSAMLFALFASLANLKPPRGDQSHGGITASGWIYGASVLLIGIGLKSGLRDNVETFATVSLFASLAMCAALITHGIGLLQMCSERKSRRTDALVNDREPDAIDRRSRGATVFDRVVSSHERPA